MSPFWLLLVGVGLAWFIASGRAQAVVSVLSGSSGLTNTTPTSGLM